MSDFRAVLGFEDLRRPSPQQRRTPQSLLRLGDPAAAKAGLARIVRRAPEVMVRVTGRTRDPGHLRAHLDYISRKGRLEMEDRDGFAIAGRSSTRELAGDWSAAALADSRRRENTPLSLSIVLSMPPAAEPALVKDAARAFARDRFADRFDYVFVLHTDTRHPHVHLAVRALGDQGERLDPRKADLAAWRQAFAAAVRDRGLEAEATPRQARGVMREAESLPLRKLRDAFEAGRGDPPRVWRAALHEAARAAFLGESAAKPWEARLVARQAEVRRQYLDHAAFLKRSQDREDRRLGAQVEAFVRTMPEPESLRMALARRLREAQASRTPDRQIDGPERAR